MSRLAEVDVLVPWPSRRRWARAATRLRLVQVPGAGLDRIDRAALPAGRPARQRLRPRDRHRRVRPRRDAGADARLRPARRAPAPGRWESQWAVGTAAAGAVAELAGKTLGILGYGRIGRALARRARAFDMEILRHPPRRRGRPAPERPRPFSAARRRWTRCCARADYLGHHAAAHAGDARPDGRARSSAAMKPTAVLVNVARAEIVDEDALYRALAERDASPAPRSTSGIAIRPAPGRPCPRRQPFHELPTCS